jgi:hypothetical protein
VLVLVVVVASEGGEVSTLRRFSQEAGRVPFPQFEMCRRKSSKLSASLFACGR